MSNTNLEKCDTASCLRSSSLRSHSDRQVLTSLLLPNKVTQTLVQLPRQERGALLGGTNGWLSLRCGQWQRGFRCGWTNHSLSQAPSLSFQQQWPERQQRASAAPGWVGNFSHSHGGEVKWIISINQICLLSHSCIIYLILLIFLWHMIGQTDDRKP